MADVADAAGVSKGAVSHVLNNRAGEIGPETRARILSTMRELGYRPPPSKRVMVRGRCDTLGIVMGCRAAELTKPSYYNMVFESILLQTEARNLNVTLYTGSIFEIDTLDKIRYYCDGRCDGLLLFGTRANSPLPIALAERAVPFVVIGDSAERQGTTCVDVDNADGVRMLIKLLVNLGHSRFAFVIGPEYVTSAQHRHEAFQSVMASTGMTGYSLPVVKDPNNQIMSDWLKSIMSLPLAERPTAILGWNDQAAHLIIEVLTGMGLRVPADVSVVGFDDAWYALPEKSPRLTTYRQPFSDIGRRAVELCLERFEETIAESYVELIPGKLIVRQTSGPAPKA